MGRRPISFINQARSSATESDKKIFWARSSYHSSLSFLRQLQTLKLIFCTDSKQARTSFSRIIVLVNQRIVVKNLGGKEKDAMNHCFSILDGEKVITGFQGWAISSAEGDDKSILMIPNNDLRNAYQTEFDRLGREKRVIK